MFSNRLCFLSMPRLPSVASVTHLSSTLKRSQSLRHSLDFGWSSINTALFLGYRDAFLRERDSFLSFVLFSQLVFSVSRPIALTIAAMLVTS